MRLRITLVAVVTVILGIAVVLPAQPGRTQAASSFDLQSDALGMLTFLNSGTGAAVPVDPKFPRSFSRVRGPLLSAEGLAAWFDPGFLLAAGFACAPECPPANPWDSTVAQTFWPQPPPQEEQVGVDSVSSPVLSFDSANGESVSSEGPASTNEGSVSNVIVGPPDAPVFSIGRVESNSDGRPEGAERLTRSTALLSEISGPGGLIIDSIAVTTEILSDGTPAGTEVTAEVTVSGAEGGGESFEIPTDAPQSALDPLNAQLAPSGVQVRPPTTCTNEGCDGEEVVGFDFISGTNFCSGTSELFCALAYGPEIEFSTPAGSLVEGQTYVLTLGRAYAQGFVGEGGGGLSLSGGGVTGSGGGSDGGSDVLGAATNQDPLPATGGGAGAGLGVVVVGLAGWVAVRQPRARRTR